ncbi:TrbC/VirB2 family protein [Luteibacter aegosomaticola]|uniref:TrbC/VirB2 family protein n=1 Tax=Luteibacter aegosomaticola TaxID=2911538 RepID=UPI001FF7AC31|nr:TrbC/VirB2 family protein [Luteibacter aegosomaticola]UPG90350.1 TrbC/VirB2 family protein [Luteibacter aegosomaticola]
MFSAFSRRTTVSILRLATLLLLLVPALAFAAPDKLPYEEGLGTLYTSLTGPVPFAISLVGIVACGAMLVFGGEISGFMRTLVFIVLVVAVIVQAASVVELLGGTNSFGKTHSMSSVTLSPSAR